MNRVVIIGASLCGLRAAEALRENNFTGELIVIGDEPHEPYDRPPLSKQVILGLAKADATALPHRHSLDAQWKLGIAARRLDVTKKTVYLANDEEIRFDKLLIATGARARPWMNADEAKLEGVLALRTLEDAVALRRLLDREPKRVLVVGAGFTGSEVASACRDIGIEVTVVEMGALPLHSALGGMLGEFMADRQREGGVDLRLGVRVEAFEGADGTLQRARLSDGSVIEAAVAVIALGSVRNVEWLQDAGLAVGPWGVACDAGCRAFDKFGIVLDDVFVAGDVARFPHPLFDYQFVTLEHWGNAVAQASIATHNMLADQSGRRPHLHVPNFWSNQFGLNIKSVGAPNFGDSAVITQGSLATKRFVMAYGHKGRVCAAVTVNSPKWLELYERFIATGAPFPPALQGIDKPADSEPMDPRFPNATVSSETPYIALTGYSPADAQAAMVIPHR